MKRHRRTSLARFGLAEPFDVFELRRARQRREAEEQTGVEPPSVVELQERAARAERERDEALMSLAELEAELAALDE